jgi:glucose dehydrogenase
VNGQLKWYYQHLPGDDWDEDYTHERTLFRAAYHPDPKFVKWFNPDIRRCEQRDFAVMVGEGGGVFALDRGHRPVPVGHSDTEDLIFKNLKEERLIWFFNTRGYWPTAYSPQTNSLYVPYTDTCLDNVEGGTRANTMRPGVDPKNLTGVAKINMSTGEIRSWSTIRAFERRGGGHRRRSGL